MELDDGLADDERPSGWISPDDRLWRHPSEMVAAASRAGGRLVREPRAWGVAGLAAIISSLLTAGLIAAAGGFGEVVRPERSIEQVVPPIADAAVTASAASPTGAVVSVVEIAERARQSIVQIEVRSDSGRGSGSGVVFRSDGHILTNRHVVEGARTITVVTADGRELQGKLLGTDGDTDIAVVKVDGNGVTAAVLGSATALHVGEPAIAVGSPLGLAGGPSVTTGVVSALGRQVDGRDGPLLDMIQTDAPIAPGSSGGALLDARGTVIGITTAIAVSDVGAEGLGFATPIDIARDVAEQLINTGRVTHVWLGIQGEDLDQSRADEMGVDGGALVRGVQDNSPADRAGLAARDVITAVEGKAVKSMAALMVALRTRRPGDVVSLAVRREGKPRVVSATLVERPANVTPR